MQVLFVVSIFFASQSTPNSHYIVLLHVYVRLPAQLNGNMIIDYFYPASLNISAVAFVLLIISNWNENDQICLCYLKELHNRTFFDVFKQAQLNP